MGLLTVFGNFRIDSEERLLRMQDSFRSFRDADIEKWVINIRGPLKKEARAFLKSSLGERLELFQLESGEGWFADSRKMRDRIQSDYVFFWIEDLLCVSGVEYFNRVVEEMRELGAEYLLYTAFHAGDSLRSFDCLPKVEGDAIIVTDYDAKSHRRRLKYMEREKLMCATFVVSAASILSRSLFERILLADDPLIKRFSKEIPFDFEKNQRDTHWLPIRVAHPKREFFAYIDDDHGRPNHSLISRGLYPNRMTRDSMLEIRETHLRSGGTRLVGRLYYYYREGVNILYTRMIRPLLSRLG